MKKDEPILYLDTYPPASPLDLPTCPTCLQFCESFVPSCKAFEGLYKR